MRPPQLRGAARAPTRNRSDSKTFTSKPLSTTRHPRAIDFRAVNAAAVACLGPVLTRLAPGGKVVSGEYVALNPNRPDKTPGSFKVRFRGPRAGAWADFATGDKGGDVVSLVAYLYGVSQVEAARRLALMLRLEAEVRRDG